tara:strand:- start:1390 stop:1746 length:357 start_codon:yes stop_codon:yes gene_type:complete
VKINKNLFLPLSYSILILFVSLIKIESQTDIINIDKAIHSVIYFIFCLFWFQPIKSIVKANPLMIVFIFSIIFGLMIELLQGKLTDYRNAEVGDIYFNLLGSFIACSFIYLKNNIKKS